MDTSFSPRSTTSSVSSLPLVLVALMALAAALAGCSDGSGSAEDTHTVDELVVPCEDGIVVCYEGEIAECTAGGSGWRVTPCEDPELVCYQGTCQLIECVPEEIGCKNNAVATCAADGTWEVTQTCDEGLSCSEGLCVPPSCEPGLRLCDIDRVLICGDDAVSWTEELCESGEYCFQGACVACVSNDDCAPNGTCSEGACVPLPLAVTTETLVDAGVNQAYVETVMAVGGVPPYTWSTSAGALPNGVISSGAGELSGTPTESGDFTFTAQVLDEAGETATAELTLTVHPEGLAISTNALPAAEEGLEYSTQLAAIGGTQPYAWGITAGALPLGLTLSSVGVISGIPTEIGSFPVTFKVFDDASPTDTDTRELTLTVKIAPLEIIGDSEYDLLFTKVITLPLITVIQNIPLPYNTKLQARGGLKPYHWLELEIPAALSFLIPTGGIPQGLALADDGTLSGSVTDTTQVVTLSIPFTGIELTGFFFMAEVSDSQSPAEKKNALFLIPTIPIGGP